MSVYGLMREATCCRFSGVVGREDCSPQELILRVMEGVARKEGYWVEKPVGWNSFIHLFYIPLIIYKCGTSHVYI